MVLFQYKAKDRRGKIISGNLEAKDTAQAKASVKRRQLSLLSLKSVGGDEEDITPILGKFVFRDSKGQIQISLGDNKPTAKEIIVFTKQFATMIGSGVPMIQSLGILGNQQASPIFRKALRNVQKIVENGSTLSMALAASPDIFDPLYLAMVEAGESSGNLDSILLKLVVYMEKAEKIKSQIKSAMAYPTIVVVVAVAVVTGLLLFVVPSFAEQYKDSGKSMPGLTQFIIDLSELLASYWWILVGSATVGTIAFKAWVKTPDGKKAFDNFVLFVPGVGVLIKKIAVGRFCSTMASMLGAGVNLLEALTICAASAGNKTIENFILGVRKGLEKGQKFSEPLAVGGIMPEMVISMVTVGESTGALDEMLLKVSDFYEEEVDIAVATVLSMIEPILIVFIGGMVGTVVIAMYLPVFDMAGTVN